MMTSAVPPGSSGSKATVASYFVVAVGEVAAEVEAPVDVVVASLSGEPAEAVSIPNAKRAAVTSTVASANATLAGASLPVKP